MASATTPVYSPANGLVKEAQSHGGYGGTVVIEHYTGSEYVTSVLGHMKAATLAVATGQEVTRGQVVGYLGTSAENGGYPEHSHIGIHKGAYQTGSSCDGGWVYAGYTSDECVRDDWWVPTDFVDSHQDPPTYYAEFYPPQSPQGQFDKYPGDTFTCTLKYWNRGNRTWYNNLASYPNDYVDLKSVYQSGNLNLESFLYDDSWLNVYSPCTMVQASVAHDSYATFQFTGRVPENATPGLHQVYFRPNHSTGGLLADEDGDWGGVNFQVNVVIPENPGPGLAADAFIYDWQAGSVHVALNANRSFDPDGYWETEWIHGTGGANDFRLFTSGSYADERQDICVLSVRLGNWDEATTNLRHFYTHRQLLAGWHAYTGGDQKHQFFMADATGDGKPDGIHVATNTGNVYVARRIGNVLSPDTSAWVTSFCDAPLGQYQFFAGDITGGSPGKADVLAREISTGNWHLAASTGSGFTTAWFPNPVLTNWTADALTNLEFQIVLSDLDADGQAELVCYRPRTGALSWCNWNGSSFTKMGTLTTDWGTSPSDLTRWRLLTGDLNHDSKQDFVLFRADGGIWSGGLSTGTTLTDRHTWRSDFGSNPDQSRYRPYLYDIGVYSDPVYLQPPDQLTIQAGLPQPAFRLLANPVKGAVGLRLDLPPTTVASLQVFDLQGRIVRSWEISRAALGQTVFWDGRNQANERVPAGSYFVRLITPTKSVTQRIVVMR